MSVSVKSGVHRLIKVGLRHSVGTRSRARPATSESAQGAARALSRAALTPPLRAAAAVADWAQAFGDDVVEVAALRDGLLDHCKCLLDGKNGHAECMLLTQGVALESIFYNLSHQATLNAVAGFLDAAERYLRLALRAQAQSRASLETLAFIRNPRSVAFVRQANIAANQQVNNGRQPRASRARQLQKRPNELMTEVTDGEMDSRTASSIQRVDTTLATVDAIDRPTDIGRQGDRIAQCVQGRSRAGTAPTTPAAAAAD